jgi:lactate dehydrogenase-like 2-hydroxyacid dehydrogenase
MMNSVPHVDHPLVDRTRSEDVSGVMHVASKAGLVTGRPVVSITRPALHGDPAGRLSAVASIRVWPNEDPPTVDELAALALGADALLCVNGDPIGVPFLDRVPGLRLVALASVGFDTVDVAAANARGVAVTHTPGVLSEAVADMTMGMIIAARRRIAEADRYVRAGRWTENSLTLMLGLDVHGATLGLVGFGAIGRAVARRAAGFGMSVLYHDPAAPTDGGGLATPAPLEELLRQSDIVSLHVPLTPGTRNLIGEAELRRMKPGATLINTSRGGIVDEEALVRALREGWIGSAALDVQAREPNPDTDDPLLALENCLVLPHIGSATLSSREAMVGLAVENVEALLAGHPLPTPVRGTVVPRRDPA